MGEKGTEQATPQRKKKALDKGDSVRSRELLAAAATLGGALSIGIRARGFRTQWSAFYSETLQFQVLLKAEDEQFWISSIHQAGRLLEATTGLVLANCFAAVLLAGIAQNRGIKIRADLFESAFSRINPVARWRHLFSLQAATRAIKSVFPAGALVFLGAASLWRLTVSMPVMSLQRLPTMFSLAYGLLIDAAWILLAWAVFDYAVEWRSWNSRLKMSKQEVREEVKESIGNPLVKGKIRQIQRSMSKRKITKADVSRASVVITNPTHYAVALEFNAETMQAPTVLAKGRGLHAVEIREAARWADVPIIENPPLARSLYKLVEPGHSIPIELYSAVAGILAFLYRQTVEERMKQQSDRTHAEHEAIRIHSERSTLVGGM